MKSLVQDLVLGVLALALAGGVAWARNVPTVPAGLEPVDQTREPVVLTRGAVSEDGASEASVGVVAVARDGASRTTISRLDWTRPGGPPIQLGLRTSDTPVWREHGELTWDPDGSLLLTCAGSDRPLQRFQLRVAPQ